jgi:hypothetical protein
MLGTQTETPRRFGLVLFDDANGQKCVLQQSSAIGDEDDAFERPGSSFVWLGVQNGNPVVLASKAAGMGVDTNGAITGWVPYPVPEGVLITTRMHLDREQVTGLIERLQAWLATGDFGSPAEAADGN